jgi:UDP-N-acetylmuramate dehydrogenase
MTLQSLIQSGLPVIPGALLKDYTTFRLGGPCQALIVCSQSSEVIKVVPVLRNLNCPFLVMGFGSNILASDQGVDRILIRYSSDTPHITRDGNLLTVDASTQLDQLVLFSLQQGLLGLEKFSGIPGTVGGGIAGNAGAYGQQISDRLVSLQILANDTSEQKLTRNDISFSYRDSSLKSDGSIILSATFELSPGEDAARLLADRTALLMSREEKHGRWKDNPCAGSFFRNVLPSSSAGKRESAGWFLEQSGCKALNIGGAHCLHTHANIITRDIGASAKDVFELTQIMAGMVKEKFNIQLEREVRLLGKFENATDKNQEGFW